MTSPCRFCDNIVGKHSPSSGFDAPLAHHEHFLLVPALGMFLSGYLLLVSRTHVTSFAHFGSDQLIAIDRWLEDRLPRLAKKFGNYFRFEHGNGPAPRHRTGACVEHAHIHLIPADDAAGDYIQNQLPWEPVTEYAELATLHDRHYSYLGRGGKHFVVPNPVLPGQWVRRRTAEALRLDNWDWAAYAGDAELDATLKVWEG